MAATTTIIDISSVKTFAEHDPTIIYDDPRGKFGVVTINRVIAGAVQTEIVRYSPGAQFRYGQAALAILGSNDITGGQAVKIDPATGAFGLTTFEAVRPSRVLPTTGVADIVQGVAHVSIPLNNWGFYQIRGRVYNANVATASVFNDKLGASAVAGRLATLVVTTPLPAEVTAIMNYAAGRRAIAIIPAAANLCDIELGG